VPPSRKLLANLPQVKFYKKIILTTHKNFEIKK